LIVPRDYLIPLLNSMVRSGQRDISISEGYRKIGPILSFSVEGRTSPLHVIDQAAYEKGLTGSIEELSYRDMVNLIVKGSGFYPSNEIDPIKEELEGLVKGRRVSHGDRPVWLFFDTCAIMNNVPHVFRRNIEGDTVRTTSHGVQNEIEEKMDMRFKTRENLERFRDVFLDGTDDLFNQPVRIGRVARLCYGELDLMRKELGRDIIEASEVGDTAILNGFQREARAMNVDGIVISCDRMMVERAEEHGMRGLYVAPTARLPKDLSVKMSDAALMIHRASVLFGKVVVNGEVAVKGIWYGKDSSDWKQERLWIESPYDKGVLSLKNLMDRISN
jgi:hypothetical protein